MRKTTTNSQRETRAAECRPESADAAGRSETLVEGAISGGAVNGDLVTRVWPKLQYAATGTVYGNWGIVGEIGGARAVAGELHKWMRTPLLYAGGAAGCKSLCVRSRRRTAVAAPLDGGGVVR